MSLNLGLLQLYSCSFRMKDALSYSLKAYIPFPDHLMSTQTDIGYLFDKNLVRLTDQLSIVFSSQQHLEVNSPF